MCRQLFATPEGQEWIDRHGDVETHGEAVPAGWGEVVTARGAIVMLPNTEIEAYKERGEVSLMEAKEADPCDGCGNQGSSGYVDWKNNLCLRACDVGTERAKEGNSARS